MVPDRSSNGIDKEDRAKGPLARFFISGWSNIVRLMAANALFIVFNIPSFIIAYVFALMFLPNLLPSFNLYSFITVTTEDGTPEIAFQLYFLLVIFFVMLLVSGLLVCIGPFQAGFAQVYKELRNGTSVSVMSGFKRGIIVNWKKSLGAMFIGFVITFVLLLAICFYMNFKSLAGTVIGSVFAVLFIAFILVQNFVYTLIVSTDLKLGKVYKNAVLFIFIRFVPCLGVSFVVLLLYFAIPFFLLMSVSYLTLGIYMFLYMFLALSWGQYFLSYYAGSLIDRFVAVRSDDNQVTMEEKDDFSNVDGLELESNENGTDPFKDSESEDTDDV